MNPLATALALLTLCAAGAWSKQIFADCHAVLKGVALARMAVKTWREGEAQPAPSAYAAASRCRVTISLALGNPWVSFDPQQPLPSIVQLQGLLAARSLPLSSRRLHHIQGRCSWEWLGTAFAPIHIDFEVKD